MYHSDGRLHQAPLRREGQRGDGLRDHRPGQAETLLPVGGLHRRGRGARRYAIHGVRPRLGAPAAATARRQGLRHIQGSLRQLRCLSQHRRSAVQRHPPQDRGEVSSTRSRFGLREVLRRTDRAPAEERRHLFLPGNGPAALGEGRRERGLQQSARAGHELPGGSPEGAGASRFRARSDSPANGKQRADRPADRVQGGVLDPGREEAGRRAGRGLSLRGAEARPGGTASEAAESLWGEVLHHGRRRRGRPGGSLAYRRRNRPAGDEQRHPPARRREDSIRPESDPHPPGVEEDLHCRAAEARQLLETAGSTTALAGVKGGSPEPGSPARNAGTPAGPRKSR